MRDLSDKWKSYIKLNTSLLLFVLIMLWIKPSDRLREYVVYSVPNFNDRVMVYGDQKMEKEFCLEADASVLELYVVPVKEAIPGSYEMILRDSTGNVIGSDSNRLEVIPSDARVTYRIRGGLKKGEQYTMELSAPGLDKASALMVAGDFSVYRDHFNPYALCALALVFISGNIWLAMREESVDKWALPVLAASGLMMFLMLAPGGLPDESFHYYSSYKMSNTLMGIKNVNEIENTYAFDYIVGLNANSAYVKQIYGIEKIQENTGSFESSEGVYPYRNPLAHLAPALGITIGRLCRLNFPGVYMLGRVFNMIQYVIMAYIAIWLVPKNKELMLMFSILPMVLQQCTGMSYDAIVNGLSLIFVAYVLKIISNNKGISIRDAVICVLILIALAPVKIVYVILALLLLAISKKYILRSVLPIGIVGLIFTVLKWKTIMTIANSSAGESWWTGGLESHTLSFLYEHPLRYIKALVYSLEMDGLTYIKDMAGIGLATSTVAIPDYLAIGLIVILILCMMTEKEPVPCEKWQKMIFIGTSVIGVVAVFTIFLFSCTVYGQPRIMGVQGRYFIPFIVPVIYCISGKKLNVNIDRWKLFAPVWFIQAGYVICSLNQINPGA